MGTLTDHVVEREAESGGLCQTILTAAEELDGVEASANDPLYAAIDVDALTAVFDGRTDTRGHIRFTWADCAVTVHSDRRVEVTSAVSDPTRE